eukprot:gene2138-2636_t
MTRSEYDNQREMEIIEENFKIIADSAPFSLWISGLDKKCFYFNKSWLDFTGRTLEQEKGNGWAEGVHADDLENCISIYVSFFNARKPFKMEYRLRRYDGVYRWVLDTGCPRFSPSGEFIGFVGSCIDVTDMWFAHHELQTYSKQQDELLHCSNSLLKYLKPDTIVSNQEGLEFLNAVLKSAALSLSADSSILFKINPENTLQIIVQATYNADFIPKNVSIFQLPNNFWEICQQQQEELQREAGTDNNIQFPTIRTSSSTTTISSSVYSVLFQNYFAPFLAPFGIKSTTSTVIQGNQIPFGFMCICSKEEREFSSFEQNTLVGMATVISIYLLRMQESQYSLFKNTISSVIAKTSSNGIITVDGHGKVVDMNPAALEIFELDQKLGYTPQNVKIESLFPFLNTTNNNTSSPSSSSFYQIINQFLKSNFNDKDQFIETFGLVNNNNNNNSHNNNSKFNNSKNSTNHKIPIQLLIKEVSYDPSYSSPFTSFFLFIFKDLTKIRNLEKAELLAKKSVQESLEKTMFLSRLSHEIRNPLNCIINMSEIILDTSISIEQKDIIETIHSAGNNLRTLLDDVLDISKIESGKLELKNEPFKVRECVEQSLAMMALSAQKKGIELALIIDNSVPDVIVGDYSKLRQVLINTIGNGVKFTETGSVLVTVHAQSVPSVMKQRRGVSLGDINDFSASDIEDDISMSPSGNSVGANNNAMSKTPKITTTSSNTSMISPSDIPIVTLSGDGENINANNNNNINTTNANYLYDTNHNMVEIIFKIKDTGIGIPDSKINKLFNNFTQVHIDHNKNYGGTGLGLAICRKIIELMGGTITVESEYGKGSVVVFSILSTVPTPPYIGGLNLNSSSAMGVQTKSVNHLQRRKSLLDICSNKKILVIAKNENLRLMISSYAKLMLFAITCCSSIAKEDEVSKILKANEKYDLILIDYPHDCLESDFETSLQMFTSQINYNHLILMTPMAFVNHSSFQDVVDAYLTKPVKLSSFEETVLKLFMGSQENIVQQLQNNTSSSLIKPTTQQLQPPQQQQSSTNHITKHTKSSSFDHQMSSRLPLTILSTEDNVVNQKVISMIFSRLGYTIDQASNGIEALELISKKKYDFVFLDIEMPLMGGLECAQQICSKYPSDQRPNLIALTGRVLNEQIQECKDSGMIDFLTKPLKVDRIIEILEKYSNIKKDILS